MKFKVSLKLYFVAIMAIIILSLAIGYSLLARHFFIQGIDTYLVSQMYKVAERFQNDVRLDQDYRVLPNHTWLTRDWGQLPKDILAVADLKPMEMDYLNKREVPEPGKRGPVIYFAVKVSFDFSSPVYVVRALDPEQIPEIGMRHASRAFDHFNLLGIIVVAGLLIFLYLLVRSIGKPVEALGQWAKELDADQLKEPVPNFRYPELNQLAETIQEGVLKVHQSVEREQKFLSHASHELRTPIAVIRTNVELLQKMYPQMDRSEKNILERLNRAGLTMSNLTNTLLWLNRDEQKAVAVTEYWLDQLVREVIDSLDYLLVNKEEVTVKEEIQPYLLPLAVTPAQIVLTNLIRNACEYTWEGTIRIHQFGSSVTIQNPLHSSNGEEDLGFGLGLRLTKQLCDHFGWQYERQRTSEYYQVTVTFSSVNEE